MNNFDYHKWQKVKNTSIRLQAIMSLLTMFNHKVYQDDTLSELKKKLQTDFLESMEELIEILESDPD